MDGGFLDKKEIDTIAESFKEVMHCFSRFLDVLKRVAYRDMRGRINHVGWLEFEKSRQ